MGKIKYTPSQYRAVTYPDGNLLLSAAAGSGKTAALTGRIVHLIMEGRAELSDMLIVTFTKAAAGEMKGRINKILREKIEEYRRSDGEELPRLVKALGQLPSAEVATIHSFLYRALKPYFPALGLSQDAQIGDTKEITAMKIDVMRDVVDDFFSRPATEEEDFVALADAIGQVRDSEAVDAELLWLAEKLENVGKDESILGDYARSLMEIKERGTDPMQTVYGEVIGEKLRAFAGHYCRVFDLLYDEMLTEQKTLEKYGPALLGDKDWTKCLNRMLTSEEASYTGLRAHFGAYDPLRLGTITEKNATDTSRAFKKLREEFKKELGKLRDTFFCDDGDAFYIAAEKTAGILYTAEKVLAEYRARLDAKKQRLSLLEYGDLERYALRTFLSEKGEPTPAALEIGGRYRYIFVDEYQDTNAVQDAIFASVAQKAVRFMVGDIKQSIYRFRGADPRVFSEYRRVWPKEESDREEICFDPREGKSLFMSENFRCSGDIIRLINAVSAGILPYGGIPYEAEDALVYGREEEGPCNPAEIVLVDKKAEKAEGYEDSEGENASNPEAVYVARRIKSMLGRYAEDTGEVITPSKVAILLRSPSTSGEDYRKELEKRGIPAKTKVVKPLSQHPAVLLLVCLLKSIDNPLRDVYTAGAMRSSLFGFTVEDLVKLRREARDLPLYTALLSADEGLNPEWEEALTEKCRRFRAFLTEQKIQLSSMSAEKFLENLLTSTDFWRLKEVRDLGTEREAVEEVLSLAASFEKSLSASGNRSLHAFLDYLEEFLEEKGEGKEGETGEAVSILSIHASKGLEYPVCFLCECAKKRNDKDEKRTILFDDIVGFGMQLPDETELVKCDNLIRKAISVRVAVESAREEMRMLYVALTRAKSKLIVTAKVDNAEKWMEEKFRYAPFSDGYTVFRDDSYVDWIGAGLGMVGRHPSWNVVIENPYTWERGLGPVTLLEEGATEEDGEAAEKIESRFDFSYEQDYLGRVPSKLVVSRLEPEILDAESAVQAVSDPWAMEPEEVGKKLMSRPDFMKESSRAEANQIGTATHRFLQFARYENLAKEGYKGEVRRLTEEKFISRADAALVSEKQIEAFTYSTLFGDLLRSSMVKREFRFNVRVNAADFTADGDLMEKLSDNNVKITVQGVVDCVYRHPETGELILVDYKTDALRAEDWQDVKAAEQKMVRRHRNQILYYKEICSRLFEEDVTKAYVYSTVLGRTIEVK